VGFITRASHKIHFWYKRF